MVRLSLKVGMLRAEALAQRPRWREPSAWATVGALQLWVQVLNNPNGAGHGAVPHPHTTDLTAQVLLAYATPEPSPQPVIAGGSPAVEALRRLLSDAQITYWECPHLWASSFDPEAAVSRATEACDNYLLVISPHALADDCCLQGLLFALSMNKRIVAVVAETVPTYHLPEPLHSLDLIDLRAAHHPLSQTFEGSQVLQMLRHEADYYQAHTRLLTQALRWERQRRDPALLLQGEALGWYQRWLLGAQGRSHHGPIHLQTLYVAESTRYSKQPGQGIAWLKRWL